MRRVPHSSDVYIGTHTSVTNATWESMGKDVQNKQTNNKKNTQIKKQTWHLILQKSPRVFKWSAGECLHSSCDVTRLFIWGHAGKGHWWCRRRKRRAHGTGLSSSASVGRHSETKMHKKWAHRVFYVMQKVKGNRRGTVKLVFVHCI